MSRVRVHGSVHTTCADYGHESPERHVFRSRQSSATHSGDELVLCTWRSRGTILVYRTQSISREFGVFQGCNIAKQELKQASLQSILGSGSLLYGDFLVPASLIYPGGT